MAKQTYTVGQVLTAAQMGTLQTNDYNQTVSAKTASYVLVAADAGTRITMSNAGATTITVNTSLFSAGDTLELTNIGAGVCTVTAGTATVSTSATLALAQYDSGTLYFTSAGVAIFFASDAADGMANPLTTTGDIIYSSSGTTAARLGIGSSAQVLTVASGLPSWAAASSGALTKVSTGAGNFTSVSSVSLDGVFSATYDYYRVVLWYISDNEVALTLRWRISAADNTGANNYGVTRSTDTNGTNSYVSNVAATSNTLSARNNGDANAISMDIFNPFLSTRPTTLNGVGWSRGSNSGDGTATINFAGFKAVNTSFDGFSLIIASGTITGTMKVYGYQN